ncbi:MAG: DUF59 domain-containing protein [Candidatus Aminicenantes bacterium]|nr:DUF59 domain-containing protein [Candidatus Aminicenantes bacterium]
MEDLEKKIIEKLKTIIDPEVGLSLYDLGLIYSIDISDGNVHIKMTLTAVGCPLQQSFISQVQHAISSLEGVKNVEVELVFDPPWNPSMMSEEAKKKFGIE